MNQLPIDKNVPLPKKYPFAQMAVGDSFLVPLGTSRFAVGQAAKRYGVEHGVKFTVRQMPDGSFRCWRLI